MADVRSIKKIDVHAHALPFKEYAPPHFPKLADPVHISPEELIAHYDKLGIEAGVLLPLYGPETINPTVTSECCKYMVDKYPGRFYWFCNIDLNIIIPKGRRAYDIFVELINHYKSLGAKGVGELTSHMDADDPRVDTLFSACEDCDMPITIHIAPERGTTYGIYDDLGLPRLEKLLQNHPRLKVFGHSQPFWGEISGDLTEELRMEYPTGPVQEGGRIVELFRKYPNLYGDLSAGSAANALMRDPDFAAKFLEEFSDRLMYGCDICHNDIAGFTYAFRDFFDELLDQGKLSEENYRKIMRENAIRILKLEA